MVYSLKLSVFALVSILVAVALNRQLFLTDVGKRIIAFWVLIIPFVFVVRNEPLNMLVFLVLPFLLDRQNDKKVMTLVFFIAILGAVPDWSAYIVSLPGINYLIRLSFDKVLVVSLLIPLLLTMGPGHRTKWALTDTLLCAFVLCMVILTFREGKITTVLRFLVDSILIYLIPYFVFTRVLRSMSDIHYCSLGFLLLTILLAAVFFVSQAVQVDVYTALNPYSVFHFIQEYRAGFLRLSGPFNGVLVGFLMLTGFLVLDVLKKHESFSYVPVWVFLGVCVLCVFFGGSRGALFGFIGGVAIYYYLIKLTGSMRIIVLALAFILLMLEFTLGISSFLAYEDEYGTFEYRTEVYKASWIYMNNNPWGSPYYLDSGYFDHLVTGLGIIDIVSAYLLIGLRYGFPGLLLFIAMCLSVIIPLFKTLITMKDDQTDYAKYVAIYFVSNLVMMFVISTTSLNSLFPLIMMLNLAIGRVLVSDHFNKRLAT